MLTIRKLMHDAGLTQQELAELADISATSISAYVNGHTKPQQENLNKLADALDWKRDPNLLFTEANDYGEGYGQKKPMEKKAVKEKPTEKPIRKQKVPTGNEIRQLIAELRHSETMLDSAQNALDKAKKAYEMAESALNDALAALD